MPATWGVRRVISAMKRSWRGLAAKGIPTASTLSVTPLWPDTRIGAPLWKAPPPLAAVNRSPVIGLKVTPAVIAPASSRAMLTANSGRPRRKLVVPSSGSTIQLRVGSAPAR